MRLNNGTIEGGKEDTDTREGDMLGFSTPLSIEILQQEAYFDSENINHVKHLKETQKIVFKNEDTIYNDKEVIKDDLSHSEAGFVKVVDGSERSFVFVFIDETIDCSIQNRMKRKTHSVLLGDRRYKVKKVFYDNEITVLSLIRSLFGVNFDVSCFMKRFSVTQISGFSIYPLAKVSDLVSRDNHMIINQRKGGNLGLDKSLRRRTGVFGLENLGNTCFMNSALQCILACKEFTDFFLAFNKSLFDIKKMPLTRAVHSLVQAGERKLGSVAPNLIKQSLGAKRSMYLEIKEQDAVEFINDLFDVIHEEIINLDDKRYLDYYSTTKSPVIEQNENIETEKTLEGQFVLDDSVPNKTIKTDELEKLRVFANNIISLQTIDDVPEITYKTWINNNRSIITDLFFSKMKSSIVCTNCKKTRDIYEPNLVHSVPVPGEGFFFENIVLFYESPEKVPLKIYSRSEMSIEELKKCLYSDYDFRYDVQFILTDVHGSNSVVSPETILSNLVGTLYCYEYQQQFIHDYYWVTIVIKSIWLSHNFDFNFLVKLESLNEKSLFDVLKCRLTPFLDDKIVFLFYENIEQFFTFSVEHTKIEKHTSELINRPFIRVEMSNYNYKRLFGKGFGPKNGIIPLLSQPVTLSDCINLFLEKEFIFGNEKNLCEHCQIYSIFYKKLDFVEFPKYLIVQLKRFKFNGQTFEKLNTFVDFSTDFITIQGVKYSIVGISNHISSSSLKNIGSNGHYTAYVRKDEWYYCNDQNVGPITDSIDKKNAYIFFLERCT